MLAILRNNTDEVRLIWRLLIIVILSVAAAFLLRFIPITIYTGILTRNGMDRDEALVFAKSVIFEDPSWSTVIGILNGLTSIPLVWFLIRVVERHRFAWKDLGLDWRRDSLWFLAYGIMLALIIYVVSRITGHAFGTPIPRVNTILTGLTIPIVMQKLALYIPMGFGEELIFRGYLQSRLVERLGAIWGILIASVVFVMLHLLFAPLSPIVLFAAVILWVTIGALYHLSKSLYFVAMFHGIMNFLDNTIALEGSVCASLIVHALVLLLVVIAALCKLRVSNIASNPT